MTTATDPRIQSFAEQGFLVVEQALDAEAVARANRAIDVDLADHDDWMHRGVGHSQHADILPRTEGFDAALMAPRIVELVRLILGEAACLEEFSAMIREPAEGDLPALHWHRDFSRVEHRPLGLYALSVVYYLTDVGPDDHCFAIVPGTHDRQRDLAPDDAAPHAVDINGPAGAGLLFHTACVHAARFKPHSTQRRTLHLYFGYADAPRVSSFTRIPDRLATRNDPALPPTFFTQKSA